MMKGGLEPVTDTDRRFLQRARCWSVTTHVDRHGEVLAGTDQGLYRYSERKERFDYIPSPMDDLHILQPATPAPPRYGNLCSPLMLRIAWPVTSPTCPGGSSRCACQLTRV